MLNEFMRERDEKQARLKQQRTTKTVSIQCDRRDALEKSDVAVQTEFPDIMDDLKEQIRQLTKIVPIFPPWRTDTKAKCVLISYTTKTSSRTHWVMSCHSTRNFPVISQFQKRHRSHQAQLRAFPWQLSTVEPCYHRFHSHHLCDHRYPLLIRMPHLCSADAAVTAPQMITGERLNR